LQENGPRTVADATAWRAESGVGWAAVDGRWRENGACLICPLGDVMPVNFAARRRRYAGRASRKQSQAAGVLVLPERLWPCILERFLVI
jgi:hypothetical protein